MYLILTNICWEQRFCMETSTRTLSKQWIPNFKIIIKTNCHLQKSNPQFLLILSGSQKLISRYKTFLMTIICSAITNGLKLIGCAKLTNYCSYYNLCAYWDGWALNFCLLDFQIDYNILATTYRYVIWSQASILLCSVKMVDLDKTLLLLFVVVMVSIHCQFDWFLYDKNIISSFLYECGHGDINTLNPREATNLETKDKVSTAMGRSAKYWKFHWDFVINKLHRLAT